MFIECYFILLACLVQNSHSGNILGVFPTPTKSHFVMFETILKALARNGHEVDVVGFFPLKTPYKRYNDLIDLSGSQIDPLGNVTVEYMRNMTYYEMMNDMLVYTGTDSCKSTFSLPEVKKLKNSGKKYDLVITEMFCTDCMLGWGYHFNVPVVLLTSSVNLPWASGRFGNPDNPSYIPTYFSHFTSKMTLYERIFNTVSLVLSKIVYRFMSDRESDRLAKEFFGPDLPNIEDLARNASLILVNSHFSTNLARPTVPNFVEVGGLHISGARLLEKKFQELFLSEYAGVIYLSMGSLIVTESFPKEKLQGMFDAFSELNYLVLWKPNETNFPEGLTVPKNIIFLSWMPQLDILCDSRVKLFVSHGGLMGTQEAIYCGVPVLGIPLFADQDLNIRQYENMGFSVKVDYDDISKESIKSAAKRLLEEPQYKQIIEKTSRMFRDRPMSPLNTSIYWIEYVMKYQGALQLRSSATDLYWFQYYLVDVIFIVVIIPLLLLYFVIKSSKTVICGKSNSKVKKLKKL